MPGYAGLDSQVGENGGENGADQVLMGASSTSR